MKQRGFTILELLIVITIIATLAAIFFPVYARSRETARRVSCASNLSQIGIALHLYAQNYNGKFPRENNEFGPLYPYAHNTDMFWCPSDPEKGEHEWKMVDVPATQDWRRSPMPGYSRRIPLKTFSSYAYKGGLTNDVRADTPIVGEAATWHGDLVNVLYVGGCVRGRPVEGYKPLVQPRKLEPERTGMPTPSGMPMPSGTGMPMPPPAP